LDQIILKDGREYELIAFIRLFFICLILSQALQSQDYFPVRIELSEPAGLERILEYVKLDLQVPFDLLKDSLANFVVTDLQENISQFCQIVQRQDFPNKGLILVTVMFPVSLQANESKVVTLDIKKKLEVPTTDLKLSGTGFDRIIENKFYRADLSKSSQSEAKNHDSGQLRELLIKMGFNQLLFRTENRLHWGPNFQKEGLEYYETIADWDNPKNYQIDSGPYLIETIRQDKAPAHPEILLSAVYQFYSNLPYFVFYSEMDFIDYAWIFLLRNDEMTMDSMFTHVAFQRVNGMVESYPFSQRYQYLEKNPISNDAPWLCLYHQDKKYAFGSIRLRYDLINQFGGTSPVYQPFTKISDGAEGGKYWNRRLINEHLTYVPRGSHYAEKNAYLVFEIDTTNTFKNIIYWIERLKNPIQSRILEN
jgi:hypothetical protein